MRVIISSDNRAVSNELIDYIKSHRKLFQLVTGMAKSSTEVRMRLIFLEIDNETERFFQSHNHGYDSYEDMAKDYDTLMEYWSEFLDYMDNLLNRTIAKNIIYIMNKGFADFLVEFTLEYMNGTYEQRSKYQQFYNKSLARLLEFIPEGIYFRSNEYSTESDLPESTSRSWFLLANTPIFSTITTKSVILSGDTETRFAKVINTIRDNLDNGMYLFK